MDDGRSTMVDQRWTMVEGMTSRMAFRTGLVRSKGFSGSPHGCGRLIGAIRPSIINHCPSRRTEEAALSQPDRNDLFQGWNLAPSEEALPRSDAARARHRGRAEVWDESRSVARPGSRPVDAAAADTDANPNRVHLGADFTLHPDPGEPGRRPSPDASTVDVAGRSAPENQPISFPHCGEAIGGFRLVSELGRGAFGRVYLAQESGLGNRPVALKVTRPDGDEPRILARLQHTHIVPIHSVSDDPESGLRLMCMPYFGGANLARVLDAASERPLSSATGRSLIDALDFVGSPAPDDAEVATLGSRKGRDPGSLDDPVGRDLYRIGPASMPRSFLRRIARWSRPSREPAGLGEGRGPIQPARRFLRESSFVRASAWIAARLAEGLEHAHSRGLLHRDLKPANILIAADGTPMLLDFNLAADALEPAEGDRAMVGGTLPYMAPEHLDAFNPHGSTPPEAVDERSDIYALGLILFEMIAGEHPFPEPAPGRSLLEVVRLMTEERRGPAPSPREYNPDVPRGLDAIIRKSLDPDPARRHAQAGDLAEDLRRFLDDRPLKYTPEPSLSESLAKWSRRNPKLTGGSTVAVVSLLLIAGIAGSAWTLQRHLRQVSARLKFRVNERVIQECQFLLNLANGQPKGLGRGIGLAEEAIRQAGVEGQAGRSASWLSSLAPDEQASMRSDLAELILLTARARVQQAERSKSEPKRRQALEEAIARLDRAETLDPNPSPALYADRALYHAALGEAGEAARDRARRDATPPMTSRDFYLIGTALVAQGRPDLAEPILARATGLDPRRFWGWFALGLCHYDQGRFAESAGEFAICAVLAPKFSWPWMNRGLALAKAGRLVEARAAYDRAVEADPTNAEALANRALAVLELGDAPAAVGDLEKAVALGLTDPSMRAALGEALVRAGRREEGLGLLGELIASDPDAPLPRLARGMVLLAIDPKAAEADFRHVLADAPRQPIANLGLARLIRLADPKAALPMADLAVQGDPDRLDALELRAWLRGRLGDARALGDVDRLVRSPTPNRLYNAACTLALLVDSSNDPALVPRALELLRRAIESGFPKSKLRDDPDLKSLATAPEFRRWLEEADRR
jgi:serine/threonine protein kinase/Flp pilus assembly protein TadD